MTADWQGVRDAGEICARATRYRRARRRSTLRAASRSKDGPDTLPGAATDFTARADPTMHLLPACLMTTASRSCSVAAARAVWPRSKVQGVHEPGQFIGPSSRRASCTATSCVDPVNFSPQGSGERISTPCRSSSASLPRGGSNASQPRSRDGPPRHGHLLGSGAVYRPVWF